jgi:hypothetical protein
MDEKELRELDDAALAVALADLRLDIAKLPKDDHASTARKRRTMEAEASLYSKEIERRDALEKELRRVPRPTGNGISVGNEATT